MLYTAEKHWSGPAHQIAPTTKHDTRARVAPDSGMAPSSMHPGMSLLHATGFTGPSPSPSLVHRPHMKNSCGAWERGYPSPALHGSSVSSVSIELLSCFSSFFFSVYTSYSNTQ